MSKIPTKLTKKPDFRAWRIYLNKTPFVWFNCGIKLAFILGK